MCKNQKEFSPDEKLKIILQGLNSNTCVNQLCRRYGIHKKQYRMWKTRLMNSADEVFFDDNNTTYAKQSKRKTDEYLKVPPKESDIILDNIPSPTFLVKVVNEFDFKYIKTSRVHQQVTGITSTEIVGKTPEEVAGQSQGKQITARYHQCASSASTITYEETLTLRGCTKIWHTTLTPLFDDHGQVTHIVGSSQDITRLKQKEKLMQQINRDQDMLLNTIDKQIWYLQDAETYGRVNEAHADFLGMDKEEIGGKSLFDMLPYEEAKSWVCSNEKVLNSKQQLQTEETISDSKGETRLLSIKKTPYTADDGTVEYVVCVADDITQQRKRENNLRRREREFKTLAENSSDLITRIDRNFRRVYTNPMVEQHLKIKKDDAMGKSNEELKISDSLSEKWESAIQKVFDTGEAQEIELTRSQARQRKYYNVRLVPEFSDTGHIATVLSISRDITEIKKMQKSVRESEERLQRILSLIPDMISVQDPKMNIVYSNWSGFGAIPKENRKLNTKCYRTYRGYDSVCPDCQAINVLDTKESLHSETMLPDGTWIDLRVIPILDDDGEVELFIEWVRDITEQKRRERDLVEQKRLLQGVIDGIVDVLAIQNADHTIEMYNRAGYELLNMTPEEVHGKKCFELLGRNTECDRCATRQAIESKSLENVEKYVPELDRYLDCRSNPILDEDGNVVKIVEHLRDMTDEKERQERIKYMSLHDSLTDLHNRRFIEENILNADVEEELPVSIIMADMNGLKLINDTRGHQVGDKMLKHIAKLLRDCCRSEDIIARWGGDEFVMFLPKTKAEQAEIVRRRIKKKCRNSTVEGLPVSLTVGISTMVKKNQSLEDTFREAEDDMYLYKLTESRSQKSIIVDTLLTTIKEKSFETEQHTRRMKDIALKIGQSLDLPESELKRLDLVITLHDIGKINLPEELLTKCEPLTKREWRQLTRHPETGYRIANSTDQFANVAREILTHHERWDGNGYPQGLQGEDIPLLARIVAVADAYEVMTNGRPYSEPMSKEQALQELQACAGTQFDPDLVEVAVRVLSDNCQT